MHNCRISQTIFYPVPAKEEKEHEDVATGEIIFGLDLINFAPDLNAFILPSTQFRYRCSEFFYKLN